jgi:hypothetical protein
MQDRTGATRRDFLRRTAAGAAGAALTAGLGRAAGKTILTFYMDDTNPYQVGADAFKQFLDFIQANELAGESSMILGFRWDEFGLISRPRSPLQRAYIEQLRRAHECGIDSHMELMTHGGLLEFTTGRAPQGVQHEGIWLYEPAVSVDQYEAYFGNIIKEGENIGVRFTGATWPGCSCGACTRRDAELRKNGVLNENPNLWKALLSLAKQGKFRGQTVQLFTVSDPHPTRAVAREGKFGVYDIPPHLHDNLGIWENNPARVNADAYITADGKSGAMVEKIRAGAPYFVFYGHWQGLNPANGVGWPAFKQVVARVKQHYGDRVVWMRPSALSQLIHSGQVA